jgi:hypothetical protein
MMGLRALLGAGSRRQLDDYDGRSSVRRLGLMMAIPLASVLWLSVLDRSLSRMWRLWRFWAVVLVVLLGVGFLQSGVASASLFILGVIVVAFVLAGCGSVDPTAQSFSISFVNDLGRPVALKLCSDENCHSFDYTNPVKPGENYPENITDRGELTRWLIAGSSGRIVGCLPLSFTGKYESVVVRFSQRVPCPGQRSLVVQHGRKVSSQV